MHWGDILYSTVRPYLHNMCIVDKTFSKTPIASTGFAVLCPFSGIYNAYLFYYLMSPEFDAYANDTENSKGVAYPAINDDRLYRALIPIPPSVEQQRIVARFENILPEIYQYDELSIKSESLEKGFPDALKKSILQHAIQGKLVPQDPTDEPARVLLERIAKERAKMGKKAAKSMSRIERRDRGTFQILPEGKEIDITKEIPFDIPDSWEWCRLGSIVDVKGGKRVPVGMSTTTEKTEHIYIRVSDMTNHTISDKNLVYVSEEVYSKISAYTISKDDLYLTIAGTIGKVGIVPEKFDGMNLTENAVKITSIPIEKRFLLNLLMSDLCVSQFNEKTNQVAQPKLAIQRILSVLIPIPPKEEQIRISDALENALDNIAKIGFCGQGNL